MVLIILTGYLSINRLMESTILNSSGNNEPLIGSDKITKVFMFKRYDKNNFNLTILPLSIFVSGYVLYTLYAYGFHAVYRDHTEPAVAFRAWMLLKEGASSLYLTEDSDLYLLNHYGPMTYILGAISQFLFGPSILASKLPNFAATVLSILFFATFVYRRYGANYVPVAVLILNCFILFTAPAYLMVKTDSMVLMLITFSLLATTFDQKGQRSWLPPLLIAITVGISVNLKVFSFIFFVPVAIFYCRQRWMMTWPIMALISVIVFAVPFVFFEFSFLNYMNSLLSISAVRSLDFGQLPIALRYSLVFMISILPLVIAGFLGRIERDDLLYFGLFVLFYALSMYFLLIAGRLKYDMFFFPVALDLLIRFIKALEPYRKIHTSIIAFVCIGFLIVMVTPQKRMLRAFDSDRWMLDAATEVSKIINDESAKTIEMGYGSDIARTYRASFAKPLLAFVGNRMIVDGHSDVERDFAGLPMNQAKTDYIRQCRTDLWLIPKGEEPFTLESYYQDKLRHIFSDDFRAAFLAIYEKQESRNFFDIWKCK
jgi:hypothetical protein